MEGERKGRSRKWRSYQIEQRPQMASNGSKCNLQMQSYYIIAQL